MKKRFLIIFGIILLFIVIIQLNWCYKQEGNLIFVVANNSQTIDTIDLEIFINDEEIGKFKLSNAFIQNYQFIPSYVSIGKHNISFKIDGKVVFEKELFLFPVRWVVIDIIEEESTSTKLYETFKFDVSSQYKPPMLY